MENLAKRINARNSRQMRKIKSDFNIDSSRGEMNWRFNPFLLEEEKLYEDCPRLFFITKKSPS